MAETVILWLLVAVLLLVGLAGLVLPALPGPPLLFGGLLLAAWIEGFAYVGTGTLVVLGVMAVLMYLIDLAATAFGAKRFGASRRAAVGAAIGALLIGFTDTFGKVFFPSVSGMLIYLLMALVLLWRPNGLFAR